jgi:hypothetical protein
MDSARGPPRPGDPATLCLARAPDRDHHRPQSAVSHRAKLFGRCERKTGIAPFDRLVAQVMREEPYRSARRVFWITDNGSSHRGLRAANRLRAIPAYGASLLYTSHGWDGRLTSFEDGLGRVSTPS